MKLTTVFVAVVAATAANGFTLSAWSSTDFTGTEFQTSTSGVHPLGFTAASYIWSSVLGDGCCVKFCRGSTETGNWCSSHSNSNVASASRFDKVVTGCGSAVLNC